MRISPDTKRTFIKAWAQVRSPSGSFVSIDKKRHIRARASLTSFVSEELPPDPAEPAISVQIFNKKSTGPRFVFLPGFGIPLMAGPGVLREVAADYGATFERFYHPDIITPEKLLYPNMVQEACSVVKRDNRPVILIGSSFGGGMAHLVAAQCDSVVGVFAFLAVTPDALVTLSKRQEGWRAFEAHDSDTLILRPETLSHPFPLSHKQYNSITHFASNDYPTSPLARDIPVSYLMGAQDPVGTPSSLDRVFNGLKGAPARSTVTREILPTGHKMPEAALRKGLHRVCQAAQLKLARAPAGV